MTNGWIILDKPTGISSAHAVAKVKRLIKPKKIGHAGTLDPLASGVLPLALGEATKTMPYMVDTAKAYEFSVCWGEERDTDDKEGKTTQTSNKRPTGEQIQAILGQFRGEIAQTPPDFSAIRLDGKRAYDMARKGEKVAIKPRNVQIDSLELLPRKAGNGSDDRFICHCGKGTYIRSLARDMGRVLGCYGHISSLRRIKVGKFNEKHAISLAMLEEMVHKGDLGFLLRVASALDDIPAVYATDHQAEALRRGQAVLLPLENGGGTVAVYHQGEILAIGDAADGVVKPRRVFNI